MPKTKKSSKTVLILAVWACVLAVAAAAFAIFGKTPGKKRGQEEVINVNVITGNERQDFDRYRSVEVDMDNAVKDVSAFVGTDPVLYAVPEGFAITSVGKCMPLDEAGEDMPDDCVSILVMEDLGDTSRRITTYVSRSSRMMLESDNIVYNQDLGDQSQKWSRFGENRFKMFHVRWSDEIDSGDDVAVFVRSGKFWRIEFTNLSMEEIAAALREVLGR